MISRKSGSKSFTARGLLIALAILCLLALTPLRAAAGASPASQAPRLSDDFTHDNHLNATLWEINGPAGLNFAAENCPSCTIIPLAPGFSAAGMEIAQANASSEVGTIQSIGSLSPPFTVSTAVEGTVSNGHPFVFGITSSDASSGVQITGNLDPKDCSNEANCGNPATCGTPANSSIPSNQCYYGIYGRLGTGSGNWTKTPALNLSPSTDVVYTLQISVDGSGLAQFNVSLGGQVLGKSSGQVGEGPFYVILAQSEGAPVPGPGPNQAYWLSASVVPTAPAPPPSSSSSSPPYEWIVILIVVALVVVILLILARTRRRELTVMVIDSGTTSPVTGAGVWAEGSKYYSGSTGSDGRVGFGGVKTGDYSVKASATGFRPSVPVVIPVKGTTKYTVRLDRIAPSFQEVGPSHAPAEGSSLPSPPVQTGAPQPMAPSSAAAVTQPEAAPAQVSAETDEGAEGWAGERIRQIIQTFRTKGAVSPETALSAEELGLSRIFVRIMKRRRGKTRVFVEVGGKYYLDEKALQAMK
ncbi:MAG: carboxypeptidase regulatory-like domain-containing protein [Thermoplasmata archaeon]